jgi:large subunit ribosomal protein L21
MYAIVDNAGKQYKVAVGDKIVVDKMDVAPESEVTFDKVLMISKDGKNVYGFPYIDNASVKAKVIESFKGDKVLVLRPRPKKSHRRLKGHRSCFTKIAVTEIIGG